MSSITVFIKTLIGDLYEIPVTHPVMEDSFHRLLLLAIPDLHGKRYRVMSLEEEDASSCEKESALPHSHPLIPYDFRAVPNLFAIPNGTLLGLYMYHGTEPYMEFAEWVRLSGNGSSYKNVMRYEYGMYDKDTNTRLPHSVKNLFYCPHQKMFGNDIHCIYVESPQRTSYYHGTLPWPTIEQALAGVETVENVIRISHEWSPPIEWTEPQMEPFITRDAPIQWRVRMVDGYMGSSHTSECVFQVSHPLQQNMEEMAYVYVPRTNEWFMMNSFHPERYFPARYALDVPPLFCMHSLSHDPLPTNDAWEETLWKMILRYLSRYPHVLLYLPDEVEAPLRHRVIASAKEQCEMMRSLSLRT